jgi:sterol desaturase/sphingolipid hydroxylase (fatty acid hydroxylase superfamily)
MFATLAAPGPQATQWAAIAGLYLAFGLAERVFPAERGHTVSGRAHNLLLGLLFELAGLICVTALVAALPPPPARAPATAWLGVSGLVFAYLFVGDFLFYWYHRAQHHFAWLWTIHELHHSDDALNVTTSLRTYWLDRPIQALLIGLPLGYLFGWESSAGLLLPFLAAAWLIFVHANLRLHLGPLTPVFVGPQLHRLHHSRLARHQGKNFAQFFPIFDVLFGTYCAPARDEFPPTGIDGTSACPSATAATIGPLLAWWQRLVHCFRRPSSVPPSPTAAPANSVSAHPR